MKKIKGKLNDCLKILLVLGLLFTNLMPLSNVFAYEITDDFTLELLNNNTIKVEGLADLDEVEESNLATLTLTENYKYLDGSTETTSVSSHDVTLGVIKNSTSISSIMLNNVKFDGLYEASVSLYDKTADKNLGTVTLTKNIEFAKGLNYHVYNADLGTEIMAVDQVYNVLSKVKVKAKLSFGGYAPSSVFSYGETDYTASELLEKEFLFEREFSGLLFGEYNDLLKVTLLNEDTEEVNFEQTISYMYGSYRYNTDVLNRAIEDNYLELVSKYAFIGDEKDGMLVVATDNLGYSVEDLYKILDAAVNGSNKVSYVIGNSEKEDLLEGFEEELLLNPELTREEYLKDVLVDNSTLISLTSDTLTITYKCLVLGDLNNDSVISSEDLLLLIDQVVGKDVGNDIIGNTFFDEEVNIFDVIYFNQVLKKNTWEFQLAGYEDASFEASLQNNGQDIYSGDEFTVDYKVLLDENPLGGFAGLIEYDKELFELVSVSQNEEFFGNNYNGKYLYLTDNGLVGDTNISRSVSNEVAQSEYTLLTLTFKALKAGTSKIYIKDIEYFNEEVYYDIDNEDIFTEVVVNKSGDNTLKSLTVSGISIQLQENVLDYGLNVSNEITDVSVLAIPNSLTATVSSIVSPEELAVLENVITIVVTAENGDELVYTVRVFREEAPAQPVQTTYQEETAIDDDNKSDSQITPAPTDDKTDSDDLETDDSNVSRIIIIILILLVIVGLIYLIFKDDKLDEEAKQVNKDINKLKKDDEVSSKKKVSSQKKSPNVKNNNKKGR